MTAKSGVNSGCECECFPPPPPFSSPPTLRARASLIAAAISRGKWDDCRQLRAGSADSRRLDKDHKKKAAAAAAATTTKIPFARCFTRRLFNSLSRVNIDHRARGWTTRTRRYLSRARLLTARVHSSSCRFDYICNGICHLPFYFPRLVRSGLDPLGGLPGRLPIVSSMFRRSSFPGFCVTALHTATAS